LGVEEEVVFEDFQEKGLVGLKFPPEDNCSEEEVEKAQLQNHLVVSFCQTDSVLGLKH